MSNAILYYVHDPMCSWCWAHRPVWQQIDQALLGKVQIQYVVGGLAPDNKQPMPTEQQETIKGIWQNIHNQLGTEFNFDFWKDNIPRRSTYPACRAVLAAKKQHKETEMIEAIQKAYYLRALNPSDTSTHLVLATELGLDVDKFTVDISSKTLNDELSQDLTLARSLPIQGFPSMVLSLNNTFYYIKLDYINHTTSLMQINSLVD